MNKQTELIRKKDWDILIILDACRYDMFLRQFHTYFDGSITRLESPASWTGAWLLKTFNNVDMKDTIYISANPFINQKNIETPFDSSNFHKVIEVWDYSYHPEEVTNQALVSIPMNKKKKFILHYMPPHEPYFLYENEKFAISKSKYPSIRKLLFEVISDEIIWEIRRKFNFLPETNMGAIWNKYGRQGIVDAYEFNLELVLKEVKRILQTFKDKKIVITADHGERLGERKRYSHGGMRDRWVTRVPWFENKEST
jgi:hypothetical protein